ncbi:hypothetical protein D3C72_633440 [compost metagenome]
MESYKFLWFTNTGSNTTTVIPTRQYGIVAAWNSLFHLKQHKVSFNTIGTYTGVIISTCYKVQPYHGVGGWLEACSCTVFIFKIKTGQCLVESCTGYGACSLTVCSRQQISLTTAYSITCIVHQCTRTKAIALPCRDQYLYSSFPVIDICCALRTDCIHHTGR